MRALLSHDPGGPDTLQFAELPDPIATPGQVVISVAACGVNFPDLLLIQDLYQVKAPRPFAPGAEISGTIVAVGAGVMNFAVGDRVCARCGTGGMAERIAITADRCTKIPDAMPFAEAAAFQFTYETAFYALITRARLQPGETVLVLGAAGGVGAASVQIAKAFGARVIAAASSADKLAFAIAQGAEDGIVYGRGPDSGLTGRELTEALKSVVGAKGADVIVDPVGGFYAEPAIRAAAVGSRYLVLGFTAGIAALPMNLPLLKSCDVLGINWRTFTLSDAVQSDANRQSILQLYADGKIAPPVMTTFPLAQGGEAIAALQRRDVLGKVVVTL